MLQLLIAAAVVACPLFATSCATSQVPSGHGLAFVSVPLSATVLQVEYHAAGLPTYQRAFTALCRCAELALDRGFGYLRIYERERLGRGEARWKVELFDAPPEGAMLVDVNDPAWEGDPPDDSVLDAASFADTCGEQSMKRIPRPDGLQRNTGGGKPPALHP